MPAATGGKSGRAVGRCEMSNGWEMAEGKSGRAVGRCKLSDGWEAVEIKPNVRLWNGAGGGLDEKIRREKVRTAKDGSKEPFFF